MIEHIIKLDLKIQEPILLHMKQYDVGSHVIKAELYDGSTPYHIPQDASVMLRYCKPDGTGGLYDTADLGGAIAFSGNIVTVPVATQVLTAAGKVEAELDIYTGEALLSSFVFSICVHMSVYSDRTIESDDYYCILTQKITETLAAAAEAQECVRQAREAAAVVSYEPQELTDAQKEQARCNIASADAADVEALEGAVRVLAAKADLPRCCTVSLSPLWQGDGPFTQEVLIPSGTENSKVDLQPDAVVIQQLVEDGVNALYISNSNGVFTAYTIGAAPTSALIIRATITEVTE